MNLHGRLSKLERDSKPSSRATFGRLLQLFILDDEPDLSDIIPPATPAEAEQLDALARELEAGSTPDAIERELERLMPAAPVCGLKELATNHGGNHASANE